MAKLQMTAQEIVDFVKAYNAMNDTYIRINMAADHIQFHAFVSTSRTYSIKWGRREKILWHEINEKSLLCVLNKLYGK